MIFHKIPSNFKPRFEVASVFVLHSGEMLMLKRAEGKSQAGMWGIPAGKKDSEEAVDETAKRELFEETGIKLAKIDHFKTIYVRYPEYDFVYHMHGGVLPEKVKPLLSSKEHSDFTWITPSEALKINLIPDEDACIKLFFNL